MLTRKSKLFITSILLIGLCACSPSVATPSKTVPPTLSTSTFPASVPTSTVIPVIVTPSPLPTQPIIPFLTPDAIEVDRWKEYEDALAMALFPPEHNPRSPADFLCEWEILGRSNLEVYVYAECMSIFSVGSGGLPYHSTMPSVIHIGVDGAVQSVEIPGAHYGPDIVRMFPPDAAEKYFGRLIHLQELTDHLSWRREHPEEPPLIILKAIPTPEPTPTEWLPFNPNIVGSNCEFTAKIPIQDAPGFSQEELAKRLFEIYLSHFMSPTMDDFCRIYDFRVENTNLDDRIFFLAKEQGVDFVTWISYSIQIKEVPSSWVAANGEFARGGWIVKKSLIIGVTKVDSEYVLKLIGTGP